MISVFLAEDLTIVRRGIASLLEFTPDIRVTGEAADGEEALQLLETSNHDVALLDIRMPKKTGIEVLVALKQLGKAPPAIMLTTFDEDPLFLQAIRAGAQGFLLKDVTAERLAETIRLVASGKTVLQPALTERVFRTIQERGTQFETGPAPEDLTPREKDVLRLIAAGYSNKEIASMLELSEGSVKNHTSSILGKLGARDRTRAVIRGIELGHL